MWNSEPRDPDPKPGPDLHRVNKHKHVEYKKMKYALIYIYELRWYF